jgi:hypothetical protein
MNYFLFVISYVKIFFSKRISYYKYARLLNWLGMGQLHYSDLCL